MAENPTKPALKRSWILGGIGVVTLLALLVIQSILSRYDISVVRVLSPGVLLELLLLFVFYQLLVIIPFWNLIRVQGTPISPARVTLVLFASHSGSYLTFGKMGIPIRIVLLKLLYDIPYAVSTTASMTFFATDALTIVLLAFWAAPDLLATPNARLFAIIICIIGILLSLVIGLLCRRCAKPGGKREKRNVIGFIKNVFINFFRLPFHSIALLLSTSLLRRVVFAIAAWIIINALAPGNIQDTSFTGLSFHAAITGVLKSQSLSLLIGIVSMLPMGLGSRDAALLMFYRDMGIPGAITDATVILERVLWTLLPLIIGVICANVLGIKKLLETSLSVNNDEHRT